MGIILSRFWRRVIVECPYIYILPMELSLYAQQIFWITLELC